MARGDGKNKFYKQLKVSKDIIKAIRYYNKVFKPEAYKKCSETSGCSSGKVIIK